VADGVDVHVVGVAVAAVGVVHGQDVGGFLAEHRGQGHGCLLHGHLDEAAAGVAGGHAAGGRRRARPRVQVPEVHDPVDPEDLARPLELAPPGGPEVGALVVAAEVGRGVADLAGRGHHQDHAVAVGRGLGHDAGGQQGLVVRVRVEGDQRVRHGADLGTSGPGRGPGPIFAFGSPRRYREPPSCRPSPEAPCGAE
jgi:hypothetical protein